MNSIIRIKFSSKLKNSTSVICYYSPKKRYATQGDQNYLDRLMKTQCTKSTFERTNTLADSSVRKKVISCFSYGAKNKRTAPLMKQPIQLSNFSPFGAMTTWTWWKCISIVVKPDYFSTFYASVATLSGFFTCCVHKLKFKRLKTCSTLTIERLLTTLLCRTNFYFFSYCSGWSSGSLFCWDKLSRTSISNSFRHFTHDINIKLFT